MRAAAVARGTKPRTARLRLKQGVLRALTLSAALLTSRMNERTPTEFTASHWRQIVNGASDTAIISTDRDGNVTSWNAGAINVLGWTGKEMLGQSVNRIFIEEDRNRSVSTIWLRRLVMFWTTKIFNNPLNRLHTRQGVGRSLSLPGNPVKPLKQKYFALP